MNLWAVWMPTVITLLSAVFIAGKIAGRIGDQEKTLLRHDTQLDEHEEKLGNHAVAIAEQKAWRDGYSAGKDSR